MHTGAVEDLNGLQASDPETTSSKAAHFKICDLDMSYLSRPSLAHREPNFDLKKEAEVMQTGSFCLSWRLLAFFSLSLFFFNVRLRCASLSYRATGQREVSAIPLRRSLVSRVFCSPKELPPPPFGRSAQLGLDATS